MFASYFTSELRRAVRNPRYLLFTIGIPCILLLVIGGSQTGTVDGATVRAWMTVNMAAYGAMAAVLSLGARISIERDNGWARQLRLTPVTPRVYVGAKLAAGMAVALPAIVAVALLATAALGVRMPITTWLEIIALSWVALIPLAAIGVALGYIARGDAVQPVMGGIVMLLSLFGGLWFPVDDGPAWMRSVAHGMPTYWIGQLSRAPLTQHWPTTAGYVTLGVWTVVAARIAMRRYRADAVRAA